MTALLSEFIPIAKLFCISLFSCFQYFFLFSHFFPMALPPEKGKGLRFGLDTQASNPYPFLGVILAGTEYLLGMLSESIF